MPKKLVYLSVSVRRLKSYCTFLCQIIRVGIEDFRFHDLRHTAASWLRMQGSDIHTVAQLLGHKDLRMASRSQHLSSSYLSNAVNGLDEVFGDLRYHSVTEATALSEAKPVNPSE